MANLGIDVGTDLKLAADAITRNGETAFRQATAEVYDNVFSARKTVAVAGTPERLTAFAGTECARIDITAELDNTGVICVGAPTVVAALATRTGTPLSAGDTVTLNVRDLYLVAIDATVSGDGVTYNYYT